MGRDQRAAALAGLDDDDAAAEPADDAVAWREVVGIRPRAKRILADQRALLDNGQCQTPVLRGIELVDAAAQHGNRAPAGVHGGTVRDRVDAQRHAADDGHTGAGQLRSEHLRHLAAVGRGAPRPNDCDGPLVLAGHAPTHVENGRRTIDHAQRRRILRVVPGEWFDAGFLHALEFACGIDGAPCVQEQLDAAPVQASGLHLLDGGAPGRLDIAAHVQQCGQPYRPDAGHAIEGNPEGFCVHRRSRFRRRFVGISWL